MAGLELISPESPPDEILYKFAEDRDLWSDPTMVCGGMKYSWFDKLTFNSFARVQTLPHPDDLSDQWVMRTPQGQPTGTALFLKSDVEQFDKDFGLKPGEPSMHQLLQWWAYTLGKTCGVGLGYAIPGSGIDPHIRVYCLPPSRMRGAIGWMYGPPLGRNRTMQLSSGVRAPYYRLRLLQHEGGHFLGHYGTSSHSGRREDIMFATLQHIKAAEPYWGYSVADIAWAQKQFGASWIVD